MLRVDVRYCAPATGTTVAKPVGDGETRIREFAKESAATAFVAVVPTVARSFADGETRPPEFEKHSTTTESNVAVSSDGAALSWPRAKSTTSARGHSSRKACWRSSASLNFQSRAPRQNPISWVSSDEARLPGIVKQGATTGSGIAVTSGEAGPSWPTANGRDGVAAAVKSFGEARPPGIAKHSTVTEREHAEGSDGFGPSWSRASGDSFAAAAEVKSAGKARPPGIAKLRATTEHELAESFDEVGPSWPEANGMNNVAARVIEAPETASQDRRLQRTVELSFVDRVEV